MKHILIALTLAISAFSGPAFALSITEGQAQHAALKAQGYSFSNPDLNTSIGTLKSPGSNYTVTGIAPSPDENVNTDEARCGYWDTVVPMPGGKVFCISMGEFTDSMNRGHDGGATSTGGPICTTNTSTFKFNRAAADPSHAVTRTDTSSTSTGTC
jgi:hypothetical protein